MGLKFAAIGAYDDLVTGLKSDQNGIEIRTPRTTRNPRNQLKSDQNGIEIPSLIELRAAGGLKSDQNGIEILAQEAEFGGCEG